MGFRDGVEGDRRRARLAGLAAAASIAVLASASGAGAQSALQVTPDEKRTLINKRVGDERWAITLNADDATVTGNVFEPGAEAQFLFCTPGLTVRREDVQVACQIAGPCLTGPCTPSQWSFADDVTLPLSFFYPPNGPTPTPAPVADLRELSGRWQFEYGFGGGVIVVYELGDVLYQFGRPVLVGVDGQGTPVTVTYAEPPTSAQYPFAMLAPGSEGCLLSLFQRTGAATIAGVAYPVGVAPDGSCLGVALGQTPVSLSGIALLGVEATATERRPPVDEAGLRRLVDLLDAARR